MPLCCAGGAQRAPQQPQTYPLTNPVTGVPHCPGSKVYKYTSERNYSEPELLLYSSNTVLTLLCISAAKSTTTLGLVLRLLVFRTQLSLAATDTEGRERRIPVSPSFFCSVVSLYAVELLILLTAHEFYPHSDSDTFLDSKTKNSAESIY